MNLVIVEDNELVLYQLMRLVAEQASLKLVGVAAGEDDAVSVILDTCPDIVLLDLSLASGTGISVLKRIRTAGNAARVLVLTHYNSELMRKKCEQYGIDGFYDKSSEAQHCFEKMVTLH